MNPERLAIFAHIQQAITALLTTYEGEFIRLGYGLFISFATILLSWHGVRMAFTGGDSDDNLFGFARLLMFTSIAYSMIAFYESPIPGVGVSFSNLLTDQAHYFATILDARSLEDVFTHLDELWSKFVQPDPWSMLATLQYWALLIVLALAKTATMAVVAFGLIASAVCALVGPIFVPFILIQPLDWMFWGWFKSFAQFSFMPVIAFAYLRIGERFIYQYVTALPSGITEDLYLLYCMQAIVVIATFIVGIFLIPSLTSSIFSGHAGQSVLPDRLVLRR
jgi:hypothetical protein